MKAAIQIATVARRAVSCFLGVLFLGALVSLFVPLNRTVSYGSSEIIHVALYYGRVNLCHESVSSPKALPKQIDEFDAFQRNIADAQWRLDFLTSFGLCWRNQYTLPFRSPTLDGNPIDPSDSYKLSITEFTFPVWIPLLLTGAYPSLVIFQAFRLYRRTRRGQCRQCSYDLRHNTSGICPECGTPIPEKQNQTLAASAATPGQRRIRPNPLEKQ